MTVILDLKKAFDMVDHKILIDKLFKYGIKGKERESFKSYISGRKQFCSVNGQRSNTKEVLCGIPQGSCLGPLLFIVHLNDSMTLRVAWTSPKRTCMPMIHTQQLHPAT